MFDAGNAGWFNLGVMYYLPRLTPYESVCLGNISAFPLKGKTIGCGVCCYSW